MPTYALSDNAIGKTMKDLYWWNVDTTYTVEGDATKYSNSGLLEKQMTLQTTKTSDTDYRIKEGVQNLFSTSSTADNKIPFTIAPNSIVRLRVYVWLEGQDIDCINYASHGGGVTLNLGLVKGSKEGTHLEGE